MATVGANSWDAVIAAAQLAGVVVTATLAYLNRRRLRVPSGGTIGERVERTHELATTLVKSDVDGKTAARANLEGR